LRLDRLRRGQALWDEVDAQFNIKPLMALNTGVQMGGWYSKEVNHPQDYGGHADNVYC
jgi:TRAP-type mannitol/chloroaromatic compound transport system substrate-binding protein